MPDVNALSHGLSQNDLDFDNENSSVMFSEETLHPGDRSNMTFRTKAINGMERQGMTNTVFEMKQKEMEKNLDEWSLVEGDIKKSHINIHVDDDEGDFEFRPDEMVRTSSLHAAGQP